MFILKKAFLGKKCFFLGVKKVFWHKKYLLALKNVFWRTNLVWRKNVFFVAYHICMNSYFNIFLAARNFAHSAIYMGMCVDNGIHLFNIYGEGGLDVDDWTDFAILPRMFYQGSINMTPVFRRTHFCTTNLKLW